jgi:hypothetical protein
MDKNIRDRIEKIRCSHPDILVYKAKKRRGAYKERKIPIRFPECKNYAHCLTENAKQNSKFGCEGCRTFEYDRYSMLNVDDIPGIIMLLRAIFFPQKDKRRVYEFHRD